MVPLNLVILVKTKNLQTLKQLIEPMKVLDKLDHILKIFARNLLNVGSAKETKPILQTIRSLVRVLNFSHFKGSYNNSDKKKFYFALLSVLYLIIHANRLDH